MGFNIFETVMCFLVAIILRLCTFIFIIFCIFGFDWAVFIFCLDLFYVFICLCYVFASPFVHVEMVQEEDVNAETEEMYVFEDDDLYELYMAPKPMYQEQDDYCKDTDPLDYGY